MHRGTRTLNTGRCFEESLNAHCDIKFHKIQLFDKDLDSSQLLGENADRSFQRAYYLSIILPACDWRPHSHGLNHNQGIWR